MATTPVPCAFHCGDVTAASARSVNGRAVPAFMSYIHNWYWPLRSETNTTRSPPGDTRGALSLPVEVASARGVAAASAYATIESALRVRGIS